MLLEKFNQLRDVAMRFKYTSFTYLDYEQVNEYEVLREDENMVLIYGLDEEDGEKRVYWATNEVTELLNAIKQLGKEVLVSFIPIEWYEYLLNEGLSEYAIFREYWISDLSNSKNDITYDLLTLDECKQASNVTLSCRGQSRGFRGENENWIYEWITGKDPGVSDGKHYNIIVQKVDDNIVGIACVTIYSYASEKGPILWIREIAVMPEYQGKGYGKKLIKGSLQYGINKGAKRAFLMADDCNKNAIRLYQNAGFIPNDEVEINMIS